MVYTDNAYIVMFGGYEGSYLEDTWMFNLGNNTWTELSFTQQPGVRSQHGMVYTGMNELLLFGGYYNDGTDHFLNDLWKFYAGPGEY